MNLNRFHPPMPHEEPTQSRYPRLSDREPALCECQWCYELADCRVEVRTDAPICAACVQRWEEDGPDDC